jgi:acid phosphatase
MSLKNHRFACLSAGLVGLLAGFGIATSLPLTAQQPPPAGVAAPAAPAPFTAENPPLRGLDANLYMQTAAEYRACCLQAYNLATDRLKQSVAAPKDGKPLAVVMDLDETVFDNAGYQAMLVRSGLNYDQRLWDMWEEKYADAVGLIPGAKNFIMAANDAQVTVVYISNRSEKFRPATTSALTRLGIAPKDPKCLKLKTTTSDKTSRRKEAEDIFNVVLYVGDQLRDFDEQFLCSVDNNNPNTRTTDPKKLEAAIAERKDKVDKTRDNFGAKWIILPNSAYGEWTKPLGLGKKDMDRLVPTITK